MDLLDKGSKWLEKTRRRYAAQTVVYRRASSSTTLRASPARTVFEVDTSDGLRTNLRINDYLINVTDLVLDGIPTEPAPGDQIIDGDLSRGEIFEVMSPSESEPAWRYSDNYRRVYRIHTKYVGPLNNT